MLDYIRSNTQSFGVKVAFGVIILVFVFWGVGSFTEGDMSRVMAKVNGEAILETQFYKRYQLLENQLMDRGMSRDEMRSQKLGRQVLQNLIAHTLVRQEAERLGLAITPLEMRYAIERNPLFQNEQGRLDKQSYERGLQSLRISSQEFEEQIREDLLYEKMLELVSSAVWVNPKAAKDRYDFLFEKRVAEYQYLPASDFAGTVQVSADEIAQYYKKHERQFTLPKKASLSYVQLSAEKLAALYKATPEEEKKWYTDHQSDFMQKEAVRAAHILVRLAPGASDEEKKAAHAKMDTIKGALKSGKKFAELANTYNEAGAADKDGELGWIERGVTVEPFEKACFALTPNVVSDVVETQFGLHLILVHEKRPEKVRPFEEVQKDIAKTLSLEKARDKIQEAGETLLEDTLLGKSLEEGAKRFGLASATTGLLSQQELMDKLHLRAEDCNLILSGVPVDTLLEAGDAVLVVRVDKIEKENLQPLEAVKAEITRKITAEKALDLAKERAQQLLKTLQEGKTASEEQKKWPLQTSVAVERSSAIAPFVQNALFSQLLFETKPGSWASQIVTVAKEDGSAGALLCRVKTVEPARSEDWDRIHGIMENGIARDVAENTRRMFLNQLFKNAQITNVQMEKADRYDR